MEPDQPAAETTDEAKAAAPTVNQEEHHQQQQQGTTHTAARSYECTFCKRGFTNAQALGGHMNIHRKDKGKVKHSSSSTTPPNAAVDTPSPTRPRLSAATTGNPFSISRQDTWYSSPPQDDDEKQPLPLFGHRDTSVACNTRQENEPRHPPSPDREVDLELRLGHVEPPPTEDKIATTRKFF